MSSKKSPDISFSQYFNICEMTSPEYTQQQDFSGERRLLFAILSRSLADLFVLPSTTTTIADMDDALRWLASDTTSECSYLWVCNHLGIDGKRLRIKILDYYDKGIRPANIASLEIGDWSMDHGRGVKKKTR